MAWFDRYLGAPWQGVPHPPKSYTCGELIRHIYREFFGVLLVPVPVPDANSLRDSLRAMDPAYFGLEPLEEGEDPREFDCVFLARRSMTDHCGIAAMTSEGLKVLHCMNPHGVMLDGLPDLRWQQGYTRFMWWKHPDVRAKMEALHA